MTLPINQSQIAHTTAEWQSLNPILALDSIGIEVMSNGYNRYKRGDGVTAWLSLPYIDKVYKQDILIDDIPTDGSGNPVASNGVYDALAGKQDKITNTANRLFYGSGTSGTLSQLALPSVAGSVLQQDTSGAPYWGTGLLKTQSFIGITRTTGQSIAAQFEAKLLFNSILVENDPLSILSLYSNGIRCASDGSVKIWGTVDLNPSASNTNGDVGHIILYKNGSVVNYFTRTYISLNNQTTFSFDPIIMGVAANDYFNFYVYSPVAGTTGSGLTMRMYAEYIN